MRRAYLVGSFLALVAAVHGLWSFRFERVPDTGPCSLADLRAEVPEAPGIRWSGTAGNPSLRLNRGEGEGKIAVRLAIPDVKALQFVQLRYRLSSQDLEPGSKKWEDGRFLIEWHGRPGGEKADTDYVASIRGSQTGRTRCVVIDAETGPAVPALRLEHLGRSGAFELADLQITPVRERALWKIGKWFLAAAWLVWAWAWMRSWPGVSELRALCASGVGLVIVFSLIIPGPWDTIHPLWGGFFLGEPKTYEEPAAAIHAPGGISSEMVTPSGELEDEGSLLLRIKLRISQARWLLHTLLWSGSSMVLALLVGRSPAIRMSVLLVLGMELAQLAFGFGSDWVDLIDLASDAAGIALAMRVYTWWFARGGCCVSIQRESS